MWFAFMRKFSQVRRQHMLSLLGLYLWRNQPVSLLLPLPFMFSVKDWFFFLSFFHPFFLWLSVVHSSLVLHPSWLWKETPSNFRVWWPWGSVKGKQHDLSHPVLGCRGRRSSLWNPLANEAFPGGGCLLHSSFPRHSHFPRCGLPRGKNGPSFLSKTSVEGSTWCENGLNCCAKYPGLLHAHIGFVGFF